jgi:hypothetical protein
VKIVTLGGWGGIVPLASVSFRFLLLMASTKDLVACSGFTCRRRKELLLLSTRFPQLHNASGYTKYIISGNLDRPV